MSVEKKVGDKFPKLRLSDYLAFAKLRLSMLVIISAVFAYLIEIQFSENTSFQWSVLAGVFIGGMLITSASNGLNQIFERASDALMKRTQERPLPKQKMSLYQAYILVGIFISSGTAILLIYTNLLCTLLSLGSLIIYAFFYTPLKKISPIAVFIGAIPGALPPLLGCVAATENISYMALLLFAIQFIWQFPHFWAIAWKLDDDYKKAGFNLLPFPTGHSKQNAQQILLYNIVLIPISILPWLFGIINLTSGILILISSIAFLIPAIFLFLKLDMKSATQLMFASFVYLPIVQLIILFNL